MDRIKKDLQSMEAVELQLLGVLFKLQHNDKQSWSDLQTISRRIKACCCSMRCKLQILEKEMADNLEQKRILSKEVQKMKEEKDDIESQLNDSQAILHEFINESYDEVEEQPGPENN